MPIKRSTSASQAARDKFAGCLLLHSLPPNPGLLDHLGLSKAAAIWGELCFYEHFWHVPNAPALHAGTRSTGLP